MSEWQPIETAPRDGTPILGWSDEGVSYVCWSYWRTDKEGAFRFFDTGKGDTYSFFPNYWMLMPDPPEPKK